MILKLRIKLTIAGMLLLVITGCGSSSGGNNEGTSSAPVSVAVAEDPDFSGNNLITYSSKGSQITGGFHNDGDQVDFKIQHNGDLDFRVRLINNDTWTLVETLVDTSGRWEGRKTLNLAVGNYVMEIETIGEWSIESNGQIRSFLSLSPKEVINFQGKKDTITDPFYSEAARADIRMIHNGEAKFKVTLVNHDNGAQMAVLADAIGYLDTEKTIHLDTANHRLEIEADGSWTIIIKINAIPEV